MEIPIQGISVKDKLFTHRFVPARCLTQSLLCAKYRAEMRIIMNELKCCRLHMGPATCALDLGDGSERGEYVNQDYILNRLGRPQRAISLMFCYYPLDEGWSGRASEAHAHDDVSFAWDYPYDDYFPYTGGINGDRNGDVFRYMRDVRRHGQDVLLTLTIDPHVSDDHLKAIGKDLSTFGRVMLRINHEANGNWFSFNKRCTYKEVADFFVRASDVIRAEAPNVKTIICIGGIEKLDATKITMEEDFSQTVLAGDIWSVDKYMALHWGWPYDVAEPGGESHARYQVEFTYNTSKLSFKRYTELNGGVAKPMVMSEFNADADVTGPYDQCKMAKEFISMLKKEESPWLSGLSFYQFRDRGGLGLELQDPNNAEVGIEQPVMDTYREMLNDPYFMPEMTYGEELTLPVTLRWGGSEDAEGISVPLSFEADPHYAEAYFENSSKDAGLMLELNGTWFYKAPGVGYLNLMSAFYRKHLNGPEKLTMKIFAPPADGENDPAQGSDWATNYYYELKELPRLRIRYAPVEA